MLNITDESSDSAETQMFPEMFPLGGGTPPADTADHSRVVVAPQQVSVENGSAAAPPEVALLLLLIC